MYKHIQIKEQFVIPVRFQTAARYNKPRAPQIWCVLDCEANCMLIKLFEV